MSPDQAREREFGAQVAVVTGAGRGLGRAVASLLAARGATVFMVDLDREPVERAAHELAEQGCAVFASQTDVTDEHALQRLRGEVLTQLGQVDILINNAGGWRYGTLGEITLEDWHWTFNVNLLSVLLTSRTFMAPMVDKGYGRIVNVASNDAYVPKPKLPHYAAAKAGVVSLTKSMAAELSPHQVLVNGVSPGAILTERVRNSDWIGERIRQIPIGRGAEPEDIGEVILFLASRRNRFVNGEVVIANGGMTMI